jgi:hypothetical protein
MEADAIPNASNSVRAVNIFTVVMLQLRCRACLDFEICGRSALFKTLMNGESLLKKVFTGVDHR